MQTVDFARLQITPSTRLLDLGCGEGRHSLYAHFFTEAEWVVAVDINVSNLVTTRSKLTEFTPPPTTQNCVVLAADGEQLPFADNSFDVIVCSEVLEHIHNHQQVLAEMKRLLQPGGRLAVSVPRAWPERICWWLSSAYHNVAGGHVRIFHAKDLRGDIERHGLQFEHRHWAHALHAPYWWLRCLLKSRADNSFWVKQYHRFLVWDLMQRPRLTQTLERALNPILGKSVVLYFKKA